MTTRYQNPTARASRDYFEREYYYEIDAPAEEELLDMEEEARAAYDEECDRLRREAAADAKQRRYDAAMRLQEINAQISAAAELDRATREIQRRLSVPAARIDVEPIAKIFVAWRALCEKIGVDEFIRNLDLFCI